MSIPKWATTVTPLSKTVAMAVFIIVPIIAFYLGSRFGEAECLLKSNTQERGAVERVAEPNGAGIANPASSYCIGEGGESKIITAADGSQSGQCVFPDGRSCDEWDFYRTKICK